MANPISNMTAAEVLRSKVDTQRSLQTVRLRAEVRFLYALSKQLLRDTQSYQLLAQLESYNHLQDLIDYIDEPISTDIVEYVKPQEEYPYRYF